MTQLKRRHCVVLMMVVTVMAAWGMTAQAQTSTPAVTDGSFEEMLRPGGGRAWVLNGSGGIDTSTAVHGKAAALLKGPNTNQSEWVHTFAMPLVPKREYVISAWVKTDADRAIASLGLRWPGGDTRVYRGLRPQDGWQKMELEFTVPAAAPAWMQVVLTGEHNGSLWWDDVQLVEAVTVRERLAGEWAERLVRGDQIYTGLVVNAKGLGVVRGQSPRIYDDEGRVIYAGLGASDEQLIGRGIAAYMRELDTALSHPRLNIDQEYPLRHPFVVDAVDGADTPRTGVVLRRHDVDALYEALNEYDFLGRFAVVFVVDPEF